MTKQERINAYTGLMLLYLSGEAWHSGFCWWIQKELGICVYYDKDFSSEFPELYKQKPKHSGAYWFDTNGTQKRINCLEKALNLIK